MATLNFTTAKDRPGLYINGYLYRFDRMERGNAGKFWRCIRTGCSGRIRSDVNDTNITVRNPVHNHLPEPENIRVRRTRNEINRRAANETAAVSTIYRQEVQRLANDPMTAAAMPVYSTVHTSAFRRRTSNRPPLPPTRAAIRIPAQYATTAAGEPFLLHQETNNEFIILCTPSSLDMLCNASEVYMDGTFDAAPHLFLQLFTIHVFQHERLIPLVYCLMGNKTHQMYESVFNILQMKAGTRQMVLNPNTIMSDFETGLILAVRNVFRNTSHKGCYFHFVQAIWRNVQRLGLVDGYSNNNAERLQVGGHFTALLH